MKPFVLYCKSYRTDILRVERLCKSVNKFNLDNLPFYVTCPTSDLALFNERLHGLGATIVSDEEILSLSRDLDLTSIADLPGSITQQIVKSEFWRLGISESALCLDSDAIFIRPFAQADFIDESGVPFTVIDEAHELLEEAIRKRKQRVIDAYNKDADKIQNLFERKGRRYNYGPMPLVWHRSVWESLEEKYLRPRNMNFADAIRMAPSEIRWYGEALLRFGAIPLRPCQSLFKVYHYAWEHDRDRKAGVTTENLASLYIGVIYQSAWERNLDWPSEGGNFMSRLGRTIRRSMGRI